MAKTQKQEDTPRTGRYLAFTTMVVGPSGNPVMLRSGDELPAWAEGQVTRPGALTEEPPEDEKIDPGNYDNESTKDLLIEAQRRELDIDTTERKEVLEALRMWDAANDE